MHIYSLQKEIKEFLRYYVLRPSDHCPPPPDIDGEATVGGNSSFDTMNTLYFLSYHSGAVCVAVLAVPVWLSTRSHVEMESLEKDLLDAARQLPNYPDQEEVSPAISSAVLSPLTRMVGELEVLERCRTRCGSWVVVEFRWSSSSRFHSDVVLALATYMTLCDSRIIYSCLVCPSCGRWCRG